MPERHPAYQIRNGALTPISAAAFSPLHQGFPPRATAKRDPKPTLSREDAIKQAVGAAQRRDPFLPTGAATTYIASSKSVEQVKSELFDRIVGADRARSLANMKKLCGLPPGSDAA